MSVWHRISVRLPPPDPAPAALEERIRRELRHCAADRVIGPFPGILDSAPDPYGPDPYGPDPYGPDPYGPDPVVFGPVPKAKGWPEVIP